MERSIWSIRPRRMGLCPLLRKFHGVNLFGREDWRERKSHKRRGRKARDPSVETQNKGQSIP